MGRVCEFGQRVGFRWDPFRRLWRRVVGRRGIVQRQRVIERVGVDLVVVRRGRVVGWRRVVVVVVGNERLHKFIEWKLVGGGVDGR